MSIVTSYRLPGTDFSKPISANFNQRQHQQAQRRTLNSQHPLSTSQPKRLEQSFANMYTACWQVRDRRCFLITTRAINSRRKALHLHLSPPRQVPGSDTASPADCRTCPQVMGLAVAATLLQEGINWVLIYRTSAYRGVKESLERTTKKLETLRSSSGPGASSTPNPSCIHISPNPTPAASTFLTGWWQVSLYF